MGMYVPPDDGAEEQEVSLVFSMLSYRHLESCLSGRFLEHMRTSLWDWLHLSLPRSWSRSVWLTQCLSMAMHVISLAAVTGL